MMLTDEQLTDLATLHLAALQNGDTLQLLPLLRAVAQAQVAAERERFAKVCDAAVKMLQASGYQQAAASVASVADDIRA